MGPAMKKGTSKGIWEQVGVHRQLPAPKYDVLATVVHSRNSLRPPTVASVLGWQPVSIHLPALAGEAWPWVWAKIIVSATLDHAKIVWLYGHSYLITTTRLFMSTGAQGSQSMVRFHSFFAAPGLTSDVEPQISHTRTRYPIPTSSSFSYPTSQTCHGIEESIAYGAAR